MAEQEGTTEVVKNELNEIAVDNKIFFPSFKGARTARDVKVLDKKNKFGFNLPIPKTDEEAMEVYNISLSDLIEKGVKQLSYGADSGIGKLIKDAKEAGVDFDKLEDATEYAKMFQDDLFITPRTAKIGAVKVAKKKAGTLDAIGASLGLTPEELAGMDAGALVAAIKKSKK